MTLTAQLSAVFHAVDGRLTVRVQTSSPLELRGPFPGRVPRYFLRNVTAGIFNGDEYGISIRASEDARVTVTPTSAAKVFVTRGAGASLTTRLEAARGALLDYDAGLMIPHLGAVARQASEVLLHEGARIAYAETLALGRLAHGERFAFERLESSLRVVAPGGATRFFRRSVLEPSTHLERLEHAVGGAGVAASLVLLGGDEMPALPEIEGVYAGVSALPHGIGWQVQALAARPEQTERLVTSVREAFISAALSRQSGDATAPLAVAPLP